MLVLSTRQTSHCYAYANGEHWSANCTGVVLFRLALMWRDWSGPRWTELYAHPTVLQLPLPVGPEVEDLLFPFHPKVLHSRGQKLPSLGCGLCRYHFRFRWGFYFRFRSSSRAAHHLSRNIWWMNFRRNNDLGWTFTSDNIGNFGLPKCESEGS